MNQFTSFIFYGAMLAIGSCASTGKQEETTIKASKDPKYNSLNQGTRYVIYVANKDAVQTDASTEIEDRIKESLSEKGMVLVAFDQNELANILRNDGKVSESQAKLVSSAADIIVTGRYREERLEDKAINASGTFRTRIRLSVAVTESNSAIERGRFQETCEELANSFELAATHAAVTCGDKVALRVVDKLLYIYEK